MNQTLLSEFGTPEQGAGFSPSRKVTPNNRGVPVLLHPVLTSWFLNHAGRICYDHQQ